MGDLPPLKRKSNDKKARVGEKRIGTRQKEGGRGEGGGSSKGEPNIPAKFKFEKRLSMAKEEKGRHGRLPGENPYALRKEGLPSPTKGRLRPKKNF